MYNKTNWQNGITDVEEVAMNNIETGVYQNDKRSSLNEKAVAELMMIAEIDGKISDNNLNKFYVDGINDFQFSAGEIDFTKGNAASVIAGNTLVISNMLVGSITDFVVGMEVTLQDGTQREDLIILTNNGVDTLTFTTAIAGTYAGNANLYRSNIVFDNGIKYGGVSSATEIDDTTTQTTLRTGDTLELDCVTIGNEQYLGTLLAGTGIIFTKSDGTDAGFSIDGAGVIANEDSIVKDLDGNLIVTFHNGTTTVYTVVINPLTSTGDQFGNATADITGQTSITQSKITREGSDVAVGILSTNPNTGGSDLVSTIKGTVLSGVITWSVEGYEQTVKSGLAGDVTTGFSIAFDQNILCIAFNRTSSTATSIFVRRDNTLTVDSNFDSNWTRSIFSSINELKRNPVLKFKKYSSDLNDVLIGYDLGNDLQMARSADGGINFSQQQIVTNASNADIYEVTTTTVDHDAGDLLIVYQNDLSSGIDQVKISDGTTTPSAPTTLIASGINPQYIKYQDATVVDGFYGIIFKDGADFKRYGKFLLGSIIEVLETVLRMNIYPFDDITAIASYLTHNAITGFTVDGSASIKPVGQNESYDDLTETSYPVGSDIEVTSAGLPVAAGIEVALKYVLTRLSTSDNVIIKKILGGVS